jgi:long-chain fatty acid transport protein
VLHVEHAMADDTSASPGLRCGAVLQAAVLCLGVTSGSASSAFADGWKVQLTGVKALGVGYAGRAAAEDATTVWFNAAGMTERQSPWTVTFGGAAIPFTLDYTDSGSRSVLGQPMTGPTTQNGGLSAFVPHLFAVRKVGDRWWLGAGFNAPYGLGDDYGGTWVGRYHATESTLQVANFATAVAVKVTEDVSLGFGLDVQRATATLANRIDFGSFGAALGLPLPPQGTDGGIELDVSSWGIGFDLSAAWQVTPNARIAATYREQVEHTLEGDATFDVPADAAPLTSTGAFRSGPATTVLPMPRELSVATAIDVGTSGKWKVVGDVTWTNWSEFQALTVSFENPAQPPIAQEARFTDSVRVAGGVIYRVAPHWTLRAGGLYEATPVPDATRTPRLPEVDNVGLTVGGTYRINDRWDLDFAWSHLIPHDAPIRLHDPSAGSLHGNVRWRTDSFAIGTSVRF